MLAMVSIGAHAQYDPHFSHYFDLEPSYNPAAIGKQAVINVAAAYALELAGFRRNPQTAFFAADMPFYGMKMYHGAGVQLMNDKIGLFSHQRLQGQYAAKFKLFGGTMSAGVQAGLLSESFDGSKLELEDPSDPAFASSQVEGRALDLGRGVGPAQGEALFEEDHARQDADDEARQTDQGVEIAAADADDHAQGAAQEDQGPDHHQHAQEEAQEGGGPALTLELLEAEGRDQRAQDDAHDLRAEVLDRLGSVEAQSAGDIPLKAGDAEAHVFGIAQTGQQEGCRADQQTGQQDEPVLPKPFFHVKYHPFQTHGYSFEKITLWIV